MEIVFVMFKADIYRFYLIILVCQFIAERKKVRIKRKKQKENKRFFKIQVLRIIKKGSRDLLI